MNIGGLQKFSLSDYPGTPCAVIFCQGCNFRCPFCHNGELLPLERENCIPKNEIFSFLKKRRKVLQSIVISGGEPTLQGGLVDFISEIKALGYQIKLDTNGSQPEVLAHLLEQGLINFIAMDIKAPKKKYQKLAGAIIDLNAVEASIDLIFNSGIPHLFRTTWVKRLLTKHDISDIKQWLPTGATHITQEFRPETALTDGLG